MCSHADIVVIIADGSLQTATRIHPLWFTNVCRSIQELLRCVWANVVEQTPADPYFTPDRLLPMVLEINKQTFKVQYMIEK